MKTLRKYTPILVIVAMALSACGVKPKKLDPPAGSEHKVFPKTYPAPETK